MTIDEAILDLRQNPEFAELVVNTYLDDPVSAAAQRFTETDEWREVQKIIGTPKPNASVLDLGAGRGIASYAFARDGWDVTALEPDPSEIVGLGAMKQLISQTGVDFRIVDAWGELLPFEDNAFDVVYCRQVLHHARDLNQLISEMVRVLKPGGTFLATREHVLQHEDQLDQFLATHPVHQRAGGEHAFTLRAYMHAMRSSGLRDLKVLRYWESPINAFPDTIENLEGRLHQKLRIVPRRLIQPRIIAAIGRVTRRFPGAMFSFVGKKPM